MPALKKYPDELRERAIRFALDLVDGAEKLSVNAATAHSADYHRSAGWHQPDGRVQLGPVLAIFHRCDSPWSGWSGDMS